MPLTQIEFLIGGGLLPASHTFRPAPIILFVSRNALLILFYKNKENKKLTYCVYLFSFLKKCFI